MIRFPSLRGLVTVVVAQLTILAIPAVAVREPVAVYFDDQFRGYDGLWSTAQIGVGTPAQYLSLLPNTVSSEIWVVDPWTCQGSLECQQERGGLFYDNRSSSWDQVGFFEMGYLLSPSPLPGRYGFDSITLSDSVSVLNQTIASFNTTELWLGSLGLGTKESEFISNTRHLALISSLVYNQSRIPSNSYGYTAGAYYSERSLAGSLTLGGTDVTRYTPNSVSFKLNSPNNEPLVAIKSVTLAAQTVPIPTGWNTNPLTLMAEDDAATFTVDSSTPFLWMPQQVCDNFASALNLTYDQDLELYIYANATTPQNLTDLGLEFTFTLAESTTSGSTVTVPISYNAFNLQLSYPFPGYQANASSPALSYFPLRRANSSLQYVIGRSFLQEAYIIVDYERGNFSISTAVFPDLSTVQPKLVSIISPTDSASSGLGVTSSSLSPGAKAGIGIGVAAAVIVIAAIALLFVRKRRPQSGEGEQTEKKRSFNLLRFVKQRKDSSNVVNELPGDRRQPNEMQADAANTRFELPANNAVEMPAGDIPDSYLQKHKDLSDSSEGEDGARRSSIDKGIMATMQATSERSQSPVPPYSADDVIAQNQTTNSGTGNSSGISSGVSPTSPRHGSAFTGTHSSGEQGISPIGRSSSTSNSFLRPGDAALAGLAKKPSQGSQHQSSEGVDSQKRNSLHSARASLKQNQPPDRTLSRSSRFREELNDESPPQTDEEGKPKVVRKRFSWEQ